MLAVLALHISSDSFYDLTYRIKTFLVVHRMQHHKFRYARQSTIWFPMYKAYVSYCWIQILCCAKNYYGFVGFYTLNIYFSGHLFVTKTSNDMPQLQQLSI